MPAYSVLRRLADVAEDQWGLVTRRQAEAAGVSRATIARLSAAGAGPAVLERVASGVYHLRGAPLPDRAELRAAWLQLAPEVPAWQRTARQGVVSHRSAASLHGLGHLPADRHELTVPTRRQTRRPDVRLHVRPLEEGEWVELGGLPVTRPSRTAVDLLTDGEDPGAVAQVIADAIREGLEPPQAFAGSLGRQAARFGLRRGDGPALLGWLLDLVAEPEAARWQRQVLGRRSSSRREIRRPGAPDPVAAPRTAASPLVVGERGPQKPTPEMGCLGGEDPSHYLTDVLAPGERASGPGPAGRLGAPSRAAGGRTA